MDFNSILIGSEDPARLAEYYTKLLGEPAYAGRGYWAWKLGAGYVTLGPHSEVKGKNDSPGSAHLEHRDRRREGRLRSDEGRRGDRRHRAVRVRSARPGSQIATFEDPDGNYFQLMNAIEM